MIHCSALPRIFACPASAKEAAVKIETTSPEAETGKRVHAAMAEIVRKDMTESIPEVQEEDKRLVWDGLYLWKKLREGFRTLAVEEKLSDGELQGTPDVVGIRENGELVVIDWKSGYTDRDYSDQLKGYLWLAAKKHLRFLQENMTFAGGRIITVWLQQRDAYDVEEATESELIGWRNRLDDMLKSGHFSPGEHCVFCSGQWTCIARTVMVRQSLAIFGEQGTQNLPVSPERLAAAYPAYRVAMAVLKRYHSLTREAVEAAGSISLPDGRILTTEPQEKREIQMSTTTLGILAKHFLADTPEDLLDFMPRVFKVIKGELEKKIKEVALPRKGMADIHSIMEQLSKMGMIEVTQTKRLTLKKNKEGNS